MSLPLIWAHVGGGPAHEVLETWTWSAEISVPLALAGVLYALGLRALWRASGVGRGVTRMQAASYAAGWLVAVLALASPLHALSEHLFSAHMVQHELLMVVAAPLLVLGRPLVAFTWALPRGSRVTIGGALRAPAWRRAWHSLSSPWHAWVLHGAAIWIWHAPVLFQATLTNDAVHAVQHAFFFGTALLFWWALLHAPRLGLGDGAAVLYLFTTAIHTGALGALMLFSRSLWYPSYAALSAGWGLTPIEDQQLAGLIMWIPATLAYAVAALALLVRAMRRSELRVVRAESAGMLSSLEVR